MFDDARGYDRFMGRWSAALAPQFLDAVLEGTQDPTAVCDVGSGTGNLAAALLERHPSVRVTGVDPSPPFVAAAQARLGSPRVRFQVGNALDLPLREHEVDAALALLVLNFVPDALAAVREMRRVTRPGGLVGAAVWDYASGMTMLRVFWDAVAAVRPGQEVVDQGLDRHAAGGGLGPLLRDAGLADVEEGLADVPQRFSSFEDYWSPLLGGIGPAGAYVAALDEDAREALRAELERRLGSGVIEMTSTARWVRGTVPG
ncbi:class I SAM-dependent methyltransferase [uncultured Phycicoccus sp.]|uniref:class I SAM-dependent methyltransferase n=1 Tax=uncultured Phycicoccus sp. TaxID=661422 RepID=UPI00261E42B9|nr:class I SAM-dependent methyltransferase [uncultured Phycicoccus sp.]